MAVGSCLEVCLTNEQPFCVLGDRLISKLPWAAVIELRELSLSHMKDDIKLGGAS